METRSRPFPFLGDRVVLVGDDGEILAVRYEPAPTFSPAPLAARAPIPAPHTPGSRPTRLLPIGSASKSTA